MAILYSTEMAGVDSRPAIKPSAGAYGARYRRYRASITLASQANADWIAIADIPSGSIFAGGQITASVSLGSSVIAIGTSPTHASNGQLRPAGTFTSVDTPTLFGTAAALAQAALSSMTRIYLTSATAALPSSGTLVVDLFYTNA